MISSVRLEPLEVILLSVVDAEGVPVHEEVLARAVLLVHAVLVDVRVRVAVQDRHGHVVRGASRAGKVKYAMVTNSETSR